MPAEDTQDCLPLVNEVLECVGDGQDHTPCCVEHRVPLPCQALCSSGGVSITPDHAVCFPYIIDITSCIKESQQLLPSSPVNFRISNIHPDFVVLHWDTPEDGGDSVLDYVVRVIKLDSDYEEDYEEEVENSHSLMIIDHVQQPFMLDYLEPDTPYEVSVEARAIHGVGDLSIGIVFRTLKESREGVSETLPSYNFHDCCVKAGVTTECSTLCSYNISLADLVSKTHPCHHHYPTLVRCSAGGRNHLPCCARRGVAGSCLPLCQSVYQAGTGADFWDCLPQIGQIFTCFEQGVLDIPPPVQDFRALHVGDGIVSLAWNFDQTRQEAKFETFEVFYKNIDEDDVAFTAFDTNQVE